MALSGATPARYTHAVTLPALVTAFPVFVFKCYVALLVVLVFLIAAMLPLVLFLEWARI